LTHLEGPFLNEAHEVQTAKRLSNCEKPIERKIDELMRERERLLQENQT